MESSWRFNVWRYGLTRVGFGLLVGRCARLLNGTTTPWVLTNEGGLGPPAIAWILPGDPGFEEVYRRINLPKFGTRFPYGYSVEPDSHL